MIPVKKNLTRVLNLFILILILVSISLPYFSYKIGDIFFGKISKLYNVNIAQFFFDRAAYPYLFKPAPYAHHQLSRTYFVEGYLETALYEAKKELDLYPEHFGTYYILGLTYGYMNKEKEAVEAFSKYIEGNPRTWAARNDKAWLQFRIGDIDGALKTIEPVATSTALDNAWIQNTYGALLMNKGRNKEAEEAFLRAQKSVNVMSEEVWGRSYPGNDPRIYSTGLKATKISIENNLNLIRSKK